MHFAKKFQQFDYDFDKNDISLENSKNFQKYGQITPPEYELSKIQNFNIVLVCGSTDRLCQPFDYYKLKQLLKFYNSLGGFVDT